MLLLDLISVKVSEKPELKAVKGRGRRTDDELPHSAQIISVVLSVLCVTEMTDCEACLALIDAVCVCVCV